MASVRRGVHRPLEDAANQMIRESLKGVTSHRAKSDILTPWKEASRKRREVYVATGSPDPSIRRGMFNRVANTRKPELNSREGVARPRKNFSKGLSDHVEEYGSGDDD